VGVLAGEPPRRQRLNGEISDGIIRHRYLGKRSVELLESMVDNSSDQLANSTKVVVDHNGRQPGGRRHGAHLDSGRSLLGQ
jgi:hypothetical protein